MLKEVFAELFERELNKLKNEINLFPDDDVLWETSGDIPNSAGNLCRHLLGNLNHYIGATLGETGYVRQRDKEFSVKNLSRADLIGEIEKTIDAVKTSIDKLSADDLNKDYPPETGGKIVSAEVKLVLTLQHFSYHLGQINYHRRFFQTDGK
jgi:hypothetical protein